jgi:hypothetical protein
VKFLWTALPALLLVTQPISAQEDPLAGLDDYIRQGMEDWRTLTRKSIAEVLDEFFLHLEGPNTPMHVGGVTIFEGPPPEYDEFLDMVAARLQMVPRFRRKLAAVPRPAASHARYPAMDSSPPSRSSTGSPRTSPRLQPRISAVVR